MSRLADNLEEHLDKNGPLPEHCPELGRCWLWTRGKDSWGYGVCHIQTQRKRYQPIKCHRLAFIRSGGIIKENERVLHKCDQPACCNPAHLYAGTESQNMKDMWMRKRHPSNAGTLNGRAKINQQIADEIRSKYPQTKQTELARIYNVSQSLISEIVLGRIWNNL